VSQDANRSEWSLLPGSRGAELCAFINKPSLITSNAFVVRTPFEVIVIDPGASVEQKDGINQVLAEVLRERPRPVFILLTHCHHDHSCHAGAIGAEGSVVKRIAHVGAIDALRRRDSALTVAELYPNAKICDARFDLALFQDEHAAVSAGSIGLGEGVRVELRRDAAIARDGRRIERQAIQLGTGDELEFYHTPGHSPDHVAMRLGRHLLVGDLPFAANPGLAGLAGWSAPALLRSIESMTWLIEDAEIKICHTGHGRSLTAEAMRGVLQRVHGECSSLSHIEQVDSARVAMLRAHALDLLDVATDLFTVIAGRMLSTAHRLEALEESAYAARFSAAMDVDGLENALADLRTFCANFRADVMPELSAVLKCTQVMQRLERSLTAAGELAGAAITARANRLLADFFNAVRGLQITSTIESIDANELVRTVLSTLRTRPPLAGLALGMGESEEAFSQSLARRLAFVDVLRKVSVDLSLLNEPVTTTADGQRAADVLMDAVELIAAFGIDRVNIRVVRSREFVDIEIEVADPSLLAAIDDRRLRLYRRMLALGGSALAAVNDRAVTLRLGRLQ
jgi:glyoxylase-like metal-dependent hydrolase (beta-lactamase superfamily II)